MTTGSSTFVVENLPKSLRVLYLGQEVGLEIMHGGALSSCATSDNPCRQVGLGFRTGSQPPYAREATTKCLLLFALRV